MYDFSTGYRQFVLRINSIMATPMRIGVAVSGGADSVLLFHYVWQYAQEFPEKIPYLMIIHIIDGNQLIDSELIDYVQKAYQLVLSLEKQYNTSLVVCQNEDVAIFDQGISIEATCHALRKKYFRQICQDYRLDKIMIGHHHDDQIEHFFIGIARKSSLKRISGMEMMTDIYIRPLLFLSKNNIKKILNDNEYFFCEDPCNQRMSYLRNNIRATILPLLNTIDSRFKKNIVAAMEKIKFYDLYIEKEAEKIIEHGEQCFYNIDFFLALDQVLQYKILEILCLRLFKKNISEGFFIEFIKFMHNKKSISHKVGNIFVLKRKNIFSLVLS